MKRAILFLAGSLLLSGCLGGGNATLPADTTPQQVSVQRNAASQALETQAFSQNISLLGAGGHGIILSNLLRSEAAKMFSHNLTAAPRAGATVTPVYSECSNGFESASVNISPTEYQVYFRAFYDAACAHLYRDVYIDETMTGQSSIGLTGNQTLSTSAGAVFAYNTLAGSATFSSSGFQVVLQTTAAASATAAQFASAGVACGAAANSTGVTCGFGSVLHSLAASKDVGAAMTVTESNPTATFSNGAYGFVINGTASSFNGGLNALTLSAGTFPAWTVSGGTAGDTATVAGEMDYSASGTPSGGSITVTDAASDITTVMTMSAQGSAGTVKKTSTGAMLATFTTDPSGNGTITYSNGTTAQIIDWIVIG